MTTPSTQPERPRMRCPIGQHNAASQSTSGLRTCSEMGLESIKRVMEHLKNYHMAPTDDQNGPNNPDSELPTLTQKQIEAIGDVTSEKCRDTADSRKRKWMAIYLIIFPDATKIPPPFCFGTDYIREKAENPDAELLSSLAMHHEELLSRLAMHHLGNSNVGAREWLRVVGTFLDILGGGYDSRPGVRIGEIHTGEMSTVEHDLDNTSGGVGGEGVCVAEQHGNDPSPGSPSAAFSDREPFSYEDILSVELRGFDTFESQ